jgi:hypothetical protein
MGYSFKNSTGHISRIEGFVLALAFVTYQSWLFLDATGVI